MYRGAERGSVSAAPAVPPSGASAPAMPPASASTTGELQRLAELRNKGVLTEDEFQAQKKRVLGGVKSRPGTHRRDADGHLIDGSPNPTGDEIEIVGYALVAVGYVVMTLGILEIGGLFNVVLGLAAAWAGCVLMFLGEERREFDEEAEFRRELEDL